VGRLLRHAVAIIVFPITVTVVVPVWIALRATAPLSPPHTVLEWGISALGVAVALFGGTLFIACLRRFERDGQGTLAPWDPPARLVIEGPYAYVRNPMISGVLLVLLAEGLILRSPPHLAWAGAFALINALYIPLFEEPGLRVRFGEEYREYARHVPRLIPRPTPWRAS
jgi:protein-S-isoprenylcysteine O-methyltransferase Ste14